MIDESLLIQYGSVKPHGRHEHVQTSCNPVTGSLGTRGLFGDQLIGDLRVLGRLPVGSASTPHTLKTPRSNGEAAILASRRGWSVEKAQIRRLDDS
jgi:hypothetical protein